MRAEELDYELPKDRIAERPLAERDASRLLCVPVGERPLSHRHVRELPELLPPSLFVLNDTRVIPARLFGKKPTGGQVELLLCERLSSEGPLERWSALGRASKGLRPGERLPLGEGALEAHVLELGEGELRVELRALQDVSVAAALARVGHMPLPPYMRRADEPEDRARYQTVYAAHEGAVAAPTAGLHLSERLLDALRARGHELCFLRLHVGTGTFSPLRSEELAEHRMHEERYAFSAETSTAIARARAEGRKVVAVGTTVVRALETAVRDGAMRPFAGDTRIFIFPGHRIRSVDALVTNFHLPESTLMMLVSAFAGRERILAAYAYAVRERYRFFSYGDAMLLFPAGADPDAPTSPATTGAHP
jgi:S-adenosylmethionine:tRNA ribosyltransferase-isomerase